MKSQNTRLMTILLSCFALLPKAEAVSPPPDGGYPGGNTVEGQNALFSLTTGPYNTAVGFLSLGALTGGGFNTAIGAGALLATTSGENTATGAGALLSNTTGPFNTATGAFALFNNTTGANNTANGQNALFVNTSGGVNTANGAGALSNNTTGGGNTASGVGALSNNTSGAGNTAFGYLAGSDLTTGVNNIDIGSNVAGVAGESNTIRIGNPNITDAYVGGINGATSSGGVAVFVSSNGKLGTLTSSARFKEEIKPIGSASEAILALKPVSFRYKKEIDPQSIPQFGLTAEEVGKVNPDLIIRDREGKPYTVRYEQINAMLLNEFLKEHRKVQELQATVLQQQKSFQSKLEAQENKIAAVASGLRKIDARFQLSKPEQELAVKNHKTQICATP